MPTILRHKGFRFFFYSNEGVPRERLHVHARKGNVVAKFWLEPVPEVADSRGVAAHELHELIDVAVEHKAEIVRFWNEHFGS